MDNNNSMGNKKIQELTFLEFLLAIIVGWILVALWQRVIENFAYNTIGMNRDSSYHALVVAIVVTAIFIIYATFSADIINSIIEKGPTGGQVALTGSTGPSVESGYNIEKINIDFLEDDIITPILSKRKCHRKVRRSYN